MPIPKKPQTEGSATFDPDKFFEAWSKGELTAPYDNDFRKFMIKSFGLRMSDQYGYRATTEVTLLGAQSHIDAGAANGLHAWYRDPAGQPVSMSQDQVLEMASHVKCSPKSVFRDQIQTLPTSLHIPISFVQRL